MTSAEENKFSNQVFDLPEALEHVGGNMDLLREIVQIFSGDYPEQIGQIRKGIASGDDKTVEHAAHSLKGSVSNFAAKRAYDAAYHLEVLGREGKLGEAVEALRELEKEMTELEAVLNAALKEP